MLFDVIWDIEGRVLCQAISISFSFSYWLFFLHFSLILVFLSSLETLFRLFVCLDFVSGSRLVVYRISGRDRQYLYGAKHFERTLEVVLFLLVILQMSRWRELELSKVP